MDKMVPALLAVAIEYSEIASVTPSHKASGRNLECRWTFFKLIIMIISGILSAYIFQALPRCFIWFHKLHNNSMR